MSGMFPEDQTFEFDLISGETVIGNVDMKKSWWAAQGGPLSLFVNKTVVRTEQPRGIFVPWHAVVTYRKVN